MPSDNWGFPTKYLSNPSPKQFLGVLSVILSLFSSFLVEIAIPFAKNVLLCHMQLLLIFFYSFLTFFGQVIDGIRNIETKASYFTTDHFNRIYFIEGNVLSQWSNDGTRLREFSDNRWGRPTYLEAENALQMVLLYPNYGTLQVLDQNLSPLRSLDFRPEGFVPLKTVAITTDNMLWIFDSKAMRLREYDFAKIQQRQSEDLSVVLGHPVQFTQLLFFKQQLYATDPSTGVYVFDKYGTFQKQFYLKGINRFEILKDQIFFLKRKQLHSFDLVNFNEMTISLPDSATVKAVRVEQDNLYILRQGTLEIRQL